MPKIYDQIAEIQRRVRRYAYTLNELQETLEDSRHLSVHHVNQALSCLRYLRQGRAQIQDDIEALLPLLLRISEHSHDVDLAWTPADATSRDLRNGEHPALPADRETTAVLELGFGMLRKLAAAAPGQNLVISPVGVALGLGMLANGARGETQQAVADTLGMGLERINALAARLAATAATSEEQAAIRLANGVWHRDDLAVRDTYVEALGSHFGGTVRALDYADPASAATVNRWASEATWGMIPQVLPSLSPAVPAYVINTTAFNGAWTEPFSPEDTRPRPFTRPDGSTMTVPMMYHQRAYAYAENERFQMVRMPYGSGRVALYVILPEEYTDLDDLLAHLTPSNWCAWLPTLNLRTGNLSLPRFRATSEVRLLSILRELGGEALADPAADFTGIADGLLGPLLDAVQLGVLEVDEAGTRAAAAILFHTGGLPPRPFEMTVNRPFFLLIRDEESGMPLFVGAINEPGALS